jgi:hypothetical protein
VKRRFGTVWSRLIRGGVLLTDFERWVLGALISELHPDLRQIVEAQFQTYALVQREFDGRALNFYPRNSELRRLRKGIWSLSAPALPMKREVAPLMKLKIRVHNPAAELHAVLRAVNGRVFSISFSEDVRPLANASGFEVKEITDAWRSNFSAAQAQHL